MSKYIFEFEKGSKSKITRPTRVSEKDMLYIIDQCRIEITRQDELKVSRMDIEFGEDD